MSIAIAPAFILFGLLGNPQMPVPPASEIVPGDTLRIVGQAKAAPPVVMAQSNPQAGGPIEHIKPPQPRQATEGNDTAQILNAIEALRREVQAQNERIQRLEEGRARPSQGQQRASAQPANAAVKFTGWVVEAFEWNRDGEVRGDPLATLYFPNERFSGMIGNSAEDEILKRTFIYRFRSTLNVRETGVHSFNVDFNCKLFHQCNYHMTLAGHTLMTFKKERVERGLSKNYLLDPGEYPIEITFSWNSGGDTVTRGTNFSFLVSYKTPSDQTFRQFTKDELFSYRKRGQPGGNYVIGAK